jgi:hypothetical protein
MKLARTALVVERLFSAARRAAIPQQEMWENR